MTSLARNRINTASFPPLSPHKKRVRTATEKKPASGRDDLILRGEKEPGFPPPSSFTHQKKQRGVFGPPPAGTRSSLGRHGRAPTRTILCDKTTRHNHDETAPGHLLKTGLSHGWHYAMIPPCRFTVHILPARADHGGGYKSTILRHSES